MDYREGEKTIKARLVAKGFMENSKENELNCEAPTCSPEGLKVVLSVIKRKGWVIQSIDIKTAYLQSNKIERKVFIQPPKEAETQKIWRLHKAVYGLKDAARSWYESLKERLEELGGKKSKLDPSIFIWKNKDSKVEGIMIVHVDDICYEGTEDFRSQVIIKLKKKIEFSREANSEFKYLGIMIKEHHDCITMDQMNYLEKKLEEVGNKDKRRDKEEILDEEDQTQYRSGLDKLNWLAQQT